MYDSYGIVLAFAKIFSLFAYRFPALRIPLCWAELMLLYKIVGIGVLSDGIVLAPFDGQSHGLFDIRSISMKEIVRRDGRI